MYTHFTFKQVKSILRAQGLSVSMGNSKIGKIPNFNLTPGLSCSREACSTCHCGKMVNGDFVSQCYACKAYRQYPNVRKAWDGNTSAVLEDIEAVETALDAFLSWYENSKAGEKVGYRFRIHSAGDFITKGYSSMWYRLAGHHPRVKFLAFTKQYGNTDGVPFYLLPNFSLRPSEGWGLVAPDSFTAFYRKSFVIEHLPEIMQEDATADRKVKVCGGSCASCNLCWLQSHNIAFHAH